jgi:adenylate cyclase
VGLLAPALAIGIGVSRPGQTLERRVYDYWFVRRGQLPRPENVVLVAIDLDSEQSLGRYPWSRDWHARVIRNLARAGARVVAFDATFFDQFPQQDTALRRVIDSTGIAVLGAKSRSAGSGAQYSLEGLEVPEGVLAGTPLGVVDNLLDPVDGVVREYGIVRDYPGGRVPQLGVVAALRYLGLPNDSVITTDDGWRIGDREIPRGIGDAMLIDYVGGKESITRYSYVLVVDDAETDIGEWDGDEFDLLYEEDRFRDKIVLVGTVIPEHQDDHPTPFSNTGGTAAELTPGVEIHAQAIETILSGRFLRVLPQWIQYVWTFLLCLLVVAFTPRLRGLWGIAAAFLLAFVAVWASWHQFSANQVWLWAATPVLGIGLSYAGSAATLYLVEEQRAAEIRGMFSKYVDSSVVNELIKHPEMLALGGEERVISIMFSDVQDFSTISEKLTPTQLVELLNEYLTAMTDIVIKHGGIIDKYQGDCIMAEFGTPLQVPDHPARACRAALEMVAELGRLRAKWAEEGKPQLVARVGINTGRALVGNLGSRHFSDYTAMGDHVNLASRLEGANKPYGTLIMVSEYTWDDVKGEMHGRELDRIRVKGKDAPVSVYEVMGRRDEGIPPERVALIEEFERALDLYKDARFAEALAAFQAIAARHPGDGPTALYIERCQEYIDEPPPPDWGGVYTMKSK